MKSFVVAAALFAGATVAQDLAALNNLPECGVSLGHLNVVVAAKTS